MGNEGIPIEVIDKHVKVINDLNTNQQELAKKVTQLEEENKILKETTAAIKNKQDIRDAVDQKVKEIELTKQITAAETKPVEVAKPTEVAKPAEGGKENGKTE